MNPLLRAAFRLAGRLAGGRDLYLRDYDSRAATYELAETRPLTLKAAEDFAAGLGVRPGARCLDLGCGTGRSTMLLARAAGPAGRVDACDLSGGMLREAEGFLAGAPCRVTLARACMLEFLESRAPGAADLAAAFWSAEYCDLPRLLGLAARALAPGGTVALLVNTAESLSEVQRVVTPVLLRNPGFIRGFPPVNFPAGPGALRAAARRSGLSVERLEERSLAHRFPAASAAVAWLRGSGPAAGLTSALRPERLDDFFAAVAAEIARRGGLTVTFRFLEFTGKKKGPGLS